MSEYFLVRHEDGAFVARSGNPGSYTRDLTKAQIFKSRESAERSKCENESARAVESWSIVVVTVPWRAGKGRSMPVGRPVASCTARYCASVSWLREGP